MLVGFVALALLMVAECPAGGNKGAAKGTDFYVYCTFDSGDYIDGSVITIDTTHGTVLFVDLVLYDPSGAQVAQFWKNPIVRKNAFGDVEITVDSGTISAGILLTLPVKSLKQYAGGTVIANGDSYWVADDVGVNDNLATGSIDP